MIRFKSTTGGISLIGVLITISILGIMVLFVIRGTSNTKISNNLLTIEYEKTLIKRTILERMDCLETLGLDSMGDKAPCNGTRYVLRRRSETPLFRSANSQNYDIYGSCKNNSLVIGAKITKEKETSDDTDLFNGVSKFCERYFDGSVFVDTQCERINRPAGDTNFSLTNQQKQYAKLHYSEVGCGGNCPSWGVDCIYPYQVLTCSYDTTFVTYAKDFDRGFDTSKCRGDNEEWIAVNNVMQVTCCRPPHYK